MTFDHSAHQHKGKDFPVKDNRARKGGRPIKPGSTASVDWDRIDSTEALQRNHAADDHYHGLVATTNQESLLQLKAQGRTSAAAKLQRKINDSNEGRLAIRSSWCQGCLNFLHNCICPAAADARGASAASLDLIRRVQQDIADREQAYRDSIKAARKQRKIEARNLRKGKGSN